MGLGAATEGGSARPNPSKGRSEARGCGAAGRPHGGRTRVDAGWTDRRRNLTALERATLTIHESTQSNEEHFLVNFLPSFTCQFIVKIVFEFSTIFLFHMITFFYLKTLSIVRPPCQDKEIFIEYSSTLLIPNTLMLSRSLPWRQLPLPQMSG